MSRVTDEADVQDEREERHPEDLLASYVLGVLDDDEQEEVEAHLSTCTLCSDDVARLRLAADALPFAVAPVAPPPASRAALLARIRTTGVSEPERLAPQWRLAAVRERVAWTLAAAGLAASTVFAWQVRLTGQQLTGYQAENAALLAASREQARALIALNPASIRLVQIQGSAAEPGVTGRVFYNPEQRTALAVVEQLPPLEAHRIYQIWLLEGNSPTSVGTFRVDETGLGELIIQAPAELASYASLGVTVEPIPGSPRPTGPIVASGTF